MKKEQLEKRKKEIELEKEEIEQKLRHLNIPEQMRDMWEKNFGWPEISQSLVLERNLDPEIYKKLNYKITSKIEEIAKMVPPYKKADKICWKCKEIKKILENK